MPTETFIATALPYSATQAHEYHVSVFITHRLTPDGAEGVLGDFAIAREWTERLASATITLRGGSGPSIVDIPVEPLLDQLDASLWPRVFPATLLVRPWKVPNHTASPWRTFPAHRMQQHALLAHAASIFSSPVASPTVSGNALTGAVLEALDIPLRRFGLLDVIDGAFDRQITARLDDLTAKGGIGPSILGTRRESPLLQLVADVHRARIFYQRTEDDTPYRERPLDGATGTPVKKPTPDFHQRAALLGDLSPLLRRLGLVIDLRVSDVSRLANLAWIQAEIGLARRMSPVRRQPRTACRVVGGTFTSVSASGDHELGMLRLGDETRYTVLDVDPDATALKLEQLVRNIPRLLAAERNSDRVSSAPATLRATGFAVARRDRAAQLHERLSNAAAKDAALLAGNAAPLDLEQITRGLRFEVWDDVSTRWHSLHQRLLSVSVEGAGTVLEREFDTGFLQGAALTQSATAPNGPKYAHEVLAGWEGWSLSAPRPGKIVVHDGGEETLVDAPAPDPDPLHPVESRSEVAPGTLPRLRYGRRYAFRAYTVDLAGNSRPHGVSGGASPSGGGSGGLSAGSSSGTMASTGVVVKIADAANQAASRQATLGVDATRTFVQPGEAAPTDLVRAAILSLRTSATEGPDPSRSVRGIDPAGLTPTQLPELDRVVAARIGASVQRATELGPSRGEQIDRAFGDVAARVPHMMERIDLQTPAAVSGAAIATMMADQSGLASALGRGGGLTMSNMLALSADLATTPRPFLRWDPVIEPAVVPRHAYTEGESLLRLVIRSGVEQAGPGELAVTVTPPAPYAAQVLADHPDLGLAWREDSQRHLAAPKTSQLEAELHGSFDSAFGKSTPADIVRAAYGVALREAGSFLDPTIADIANPGQRIAQPGITFHVTPTAEAPEHATPADLPDGDPLTPGQYVAHDVDELTLPYLPDPLAVGVSFTFPDAGKDHRLSGLLAVEGTTLRYLGDWPERRPHRLVLESGSELGVAVEDHVIRVTLPPGEQLRMRMSTSLSRESLDLFGLWRSLPQPFRDHPVLREAAADGWFWWLTPSTEMRLVHAVQRPVEVPRPTLLIPVRAPGDTAVALFGAVDLHGPSIDRIDVEASWTQWVDDTSKPGPELVSGNAAAFGTAIEPDEDLAVLAAADSTLPQPDGSVIRLHAAVHQTGDTQHRMIDYRVRATTRYREYFLPQVTPDVDDLSVVGPARTINVPSSARPEKVLVRDVLPLFRWDAHTEPAQPYGFRRTRRAGARIYLERPWYTTGDGELLGVLLAAGSDALVNGSVSRWGGDPVWQQQGPALRSSLPLVDLLQMTGLDDREVPGRPVGPAVSRQLMDVHGQPAVWVLGYKPEYSMSRGLWFVDVALDPGTAFWPFVQFAVARYQPNSLPGLHLGPVTMCDFVQLAPERISTLSRTDETHTRVVVTGAVGHPRAGTRSPLAQAPFLAQVSATRTMRARLERYDATVGTDLGWATVSQSDLPILGAEGTTVSWAGEIELPVAVPPRTPGTNMEWRVTLEEWEYLPADHGAGGTGGLEPRIVYADHLPL